MPEPVYNKDTFAFDAIGVALSHPVDSVPPGLTPILENWRPEIDNTLSVRPGQGTGREVVAGQSPVHSVMRLDDSSSGTLVSTEIVGTGTHLAICATDLTSSGSSDSGYSGDPLSMVKHQPVESLKEWLYVADRLRMRKIDQAGNDKRIGLTALTTPPTPKLGIPSYKMLEEMNAAASWTQGGTAAAPSNNTRIDGATRTVTRFLWDTGSTGWACVRPSSMADVGVGTRLTVDTGGSLETIVVEQVFRCSSTSTTIASIIYESGAGSGMCGIHLTTPFLDIQPDSLIYIDDGAGTTEYARVLNVTKTPEGMTSIVCSLTSNFLGGATVTTYASFRAYFTVTHANGVAMSAASVQFNVTAGKGWIEQTLALDLSFIASGLPTQLEDLMHIDLYADDPSVVNEVRLMLDIDSATNDFTRNYLFYAVRSADLTPAAAGDQTVLSNRQIQKQRDIIFAGKVLDPNESVPNEDALPDVGGDRAKEIERNLSAGSNQWANVTFRISELLDPSIGRVGSDLSRGLSNIAKLRIWVWCTDAVTIRVDGWWIGGGYGPEVGVAERPLIYRVRGRDTSTGVVSNFSPASRVSVRPNRQQVLVTSAVHPDAECDVLDFQRYGGSLLGWYYVGTVDNSGTPQLTDDVSPNVLPRLRALSEGDTYYELWPIISIPVSGTSATTAGSLVQIGGFGAVSASMAPGAIIRLADKYYTVSQVVDTNTLWIHESAGALSGVDWEIAAPLLIGQPLPILTGPYLGFFFGSGDKLNPGRVYYTNGNNADSTQDSHYFDIPGENIQSIVVVAEWAIAFGVYGVYGIEPTFSLADSGGNLFRYVKLTSDSTLFSRWALCSTGKSVIYLGKDGGLYETVGGSSVLLTDALKPLFPHEGSLGIAVNGFQPPNVVAAQAANLRLSHCAGEVFFDYIDTSSGRRTLVWSRRSERIGWRPYSYSVGAQMHYAEDGQNVNSVLLGGTDGKLYRLARAAADAAGASITATVRTPSQNLGDPTNQKLISELRISYDTDGGTISVTPGFDNHSSTPYAATTLNEASGRRQRTIDIDSGRGKLALNTSLHIATTVTTQRPTLYFWAVTHQPRPDTTALRTADWRVGPHPVNYIRGVWIHGDTFNTSRSAEFEYQKDDGSTAAVTISGIDIDVLGRRYFPLTTPVYALAHRLRPTDAGTWQLLSYDLEADAAPPSTTARTEIIALGGARFVHGITVDIDTQGANIDLTVKGDADATLATISSGNNSGPANTNGRAQLPFSFEVPFITHLIYLTRSAACRIWGVKVDDNPEPELAYMWRSQQTNCGIPGWKLFGDGLISIRSTEAVRFFIIADGTSYEATFYDASTNTSGNRRRLRFRMPPIKAKSVEFQCNTVTEAGRVAVYEADFTLELKEWGFEGGWQNINPIGARHRQTGAPI